MKEKRHDQIRFLFILVTKVLRIHKIKGPGRFRRIERALQLAGAVEIQ
jgi:hypothetical protein